MGQSSEPHVELLLVVWLVHTPAGTVAFLSAIAAFVYSKGSWAHRRSGRYFYRFHANYGRIWKSCWIPERHSQRCVFGINGILLCIYSLVDNIP